MKNYLCEDAVMCLDHSHAYHLCITHTSDSKSVVWKKTASFLLCDVCFPLKIVEGKEFDKMKYASVWVLHLLKQFAGD